MELKQIMSKEVAGVLEEATGIVTNRLVMESLLKNGKVTIEEATFLNKLASEVITEAAEDFIPDSIEVPDAPAADQVVEESTQTTDKVAADQVVEESTQTTDQVEDQAADKVEDQVADKVELTESEAIVNNLINKLF